MDEMLELRDFYISQIEYMEQALADYKKELADLEKQIIDQTGAS